MGNVFFTSDLHFGHARVAELRGFGVGPDAVAAHDDAIRDNWSRAVRPDDQVWVLGDIAASSPAYALTLLEMLPGEKHLVAGNHDVCHPMHRNAHKQAAVFLDVFQSVQAFARRKVAGVDVLLSHFPYWTDHTPEPRHTQWRLRDEGAWLLHGHTHGTERLHGYELHVGVDAWDLAPVALSTVADLIKTGV